MAAWTDGDNMSPKRRNREWIMTRLVAPAYDINNGGSVTAESKSIDGDEIVTSESTRYTAGAGVTVAIVHSLTICNNDSVPNQASVHIVPAGGSRQVANCIFDDELPVGDTVSLLGPWFMDPLDTIRNISATASTQELAMRGEALELTGAIDGVTLKVVDGVALTGSFATYYTCPTSLVQHALVWVTICNTDSANRTVQVQIRPSGSSNDAGRQNVINDTLFAGETLILGGPTSPYVLEPGDQIRAFAGATGVVSIRVSAVELATS